MTKKAEKGSNFKVYHRMPCNRGNYLPIRERNSIVFPDKKQITNLFNLQQLAEAIPYLPDLQIDAEVEFLLHLEGVTWVWRSCATPVKTNLTTRQMITQLEERSGYHYRCQRYQQTLLDGKKTLKMPFFLPDMVLLPLEGACNHSATWLNLLQIIKIKKCKETQCCIVFFKGGNQLLLPYSYHMVKKNIQKATLKLWDWYLNYFKLQAGVRDVSRIQNYLTGDFAEKQIHRIQNSGTCRVREDWHSCQGKADMLYHLVTVHPKCTIEELVEYYINHPIEERIKSKL